MARVVVAGAVVECPHGGQLKLTAGDGRLEVGGKAVVTSGMEAGLAFAPGAPGVVAPCTHTTPNGAPSPCSGTQPASATATKLFVGEQAALLEGASGPVLNPASPGATWKLSDPGQSLLEAA